MIRKGDTLYIKDKTGPTTGRVVCCGKHGVTVDCDGKRRKIRWSGVLGRKEVVNSQAKVVDQGVDGAIVEDGDGRRSYVHGYQAPEPEEQKEKRGAWDDLQLRKASVALFAKAGPQKPA